MVTVEDRLSDFPESGRGIEVDDRYRLDAARLLEILQEVRTASGSSIPTFFLRGKGIEIYCTYKKQEGGETGLPAGMLVSGSHVNQPPSEIYLVIFRHTDKEMIGAQPAFNLLDVLRKYIS